MLFQDEETEALLSADFEIGHFFRERVIPKVELSRSLLKCCRDLFLGNTSEHNYIPLRIVGCFEV